jgi:glycosyltransferase involved in cell wall biosynthesis
VAFPVFAHPQITTRVKLPHDYPVEASRPARIFFGGNTVEGKYNKDVLRDVYRMLSRREMLDVVGAAVPPHRPADAASWLAAAEFHPFVLCETQHCKIPQERWLEALAKADFFLACPGVGMPLCHNLIEAMAAGAVPILQYGDYLPQPLEDGVNCLAFRNPAGLQEITAKVLTMSQEQIRSLRGNVRGYYDEFLAPGRFAARLFARPQLETTLLLNAYRVPRK